MAKCFSVIQRLFCRISGLQNKQTPSANLCDAGSDPSSCTKKDWTFFAITFFLLFCSFYHNTIASGFDLLPGDDGDTRFNLLIIEHWIQFFCGGLGFAEPRMFYPAGYGLGFSDLSLLPALLELPLRLTGLDLYRSSQIVYYLLHFIGAASCFYLLRRQLYLSLLPSLTGMLIICFSNAMYVKLYHTQFYNYYLLPLLLVLIIQYCRYPAGTKFGRRAITLIAAMLTAVLILYSGFYTIFYTVFFSAAFAAGCLLAFLYRQNREDVSAFLQWLKIRLPEAALTAFLGLAALIPFLIIYWPVVQLGYKRPWYEIRKCLLKPYDFFNVGADNFLWSSWLKNTFPQQLDRPYAHELQYGLPILTLILLVIALIFFVSRIKKGMEIQYTFFFAAVFALIFCMLAITAGEGVNTPWNFIRKLPVASAIRQVSRFMVILMLPMGILIAVFLNTVQQKLENKKRKSGVILISFILICIYLDHLNLGNNSEFSISGIREYTASLAKPPEDCRIFFITIQPDPVHASWTKDEMNFEQSLSQLDAMTIAAHFKLKTLNGYSGHAPRNWDLHFVFRKDYMSLVQKWIKTQSIREPVYRYDCTENKWYGPVNLKTPELQ